MNKMIDSHAHYNHSKYESDRNKILADMKSDIGAILNVGTNTKSIKDTIKLIDKYDYLYGIIGYFPSDTVELVNPEIRKFLEDSIKNKKVVGIGEIGLDYYWDKPAHDIQEKYLRYQIELAIENDLPISIHSRDAELDTMRILSDYEFKGVIHCYSYGLESAQEYVKKGLYFGIGGTTTYSSNVVGHEVVKYLPLTQILLETDAPYLTPVPFRGKRNDSRYLIHIAKKISELKGISVEDVIKVTTDNAIKLFGVEVYE